MIAMLRNQLIILPRKMFNNMIAAEGNIKYRIPLILMLVCLQRIANLPDRPALPVAEPVEATTFCF